jgi:hypothetical protein
MVGDEMQTLIREITSLKAANALIIAQQETSLSQLRATSKLCSQLEYEKRELKKRFQSLKST